MKAAEAFFEVWGETSDYDTLCRIMAARWLKNYIDRSKLMKIVMMELENGKMTMEHYETYDRLFKDLERYNELTRGE